MLEPYTNPVICLCLSGLPRPRRRHLGSSSVLSAEGIVCLYKHATSDDLSPPQRPPTVAPWLHAWEKTRGGWEEGKNYTVPVLPFLSPALPSPSFLSQEPLRRRESGDPWPKGKAITNHEGDDITPLSDLSSLLKYNLCQGKIKWGPEELNLNVWITLRTSYFVKYITS